MIQEIAVSVLWPEFRTWKGPVQDCQQNFCQANHTTGGLGSQAGHVMTTHGQPVRLVSLGFLAIRWWLPTPHSNLISLWPQPTNQRSKWPFLSGIFFAFSVHAKLWQKGFGEKIRGMLIQAVEHKKKLMSQPYRNKNSQTSGSTNSTQFPETVSPTKGLEDFERKTKAKEATKNIRKTDKDLIWHYYVNVHAFFHLFLQLDLSKQSLFQVHLQPSYSASQVQIAHGTGTSFFAVKATAFGNFLLAKILWFCIYIFKSRINIYIYILHFLSEKKTPTRPSIVGSSVIEISSSYSTINLYHQQKIWRIDLLKKRVLRWLQGNSLRWSCSFAERNVETSPRSFGIYGRRQGCCHFCHNEDLHKSISVA